MLGNGSRNGNGVRERFPDFGCMAGFNADRWVAVRRSGAAPGDDPPGRVAFGGSGAWPFPPPGTVPVGS